MVSIFDVIILIVLSGFVFFGLFLGLIQGLGALLGVIAGAFIAGRYFLPVSAWFGNLTGLANNFIKVAVFIIIYILVARLVGLVFYLINKIFKFVSIIPFLKLINRLMGGILGFAEGSLIIGLSLYILTKYPINAVLDSSLRASKIAPFLMKIAQILLPLIPTAVRAIQGIL